MEPPAASSISFRIYLLLLLTLPALAISYYFGIALPGYYREQIALQRQQSIAQQLIMQTQADEAEKDKIGLDVCREAADKSYDELLAENTKPVPGSNPPKVSVPEDIEEYARKKKREDLDDCYKMYRK